MQLSLFNIFKKSPPPLKKKRLARKTRVDDQKLKLIWLSLCRQYFPLNSKLEAYNVYWSKRPQLRTLATCHYETNKVIVARELNYPEHDSWLEPLLYHEMCHAVLGGIKHEGSTKYSWHGKEFRELEAKHPKIKALDHWMKSGGWAKAVRSDRSKRAWAARKESV